MRLSKDQYKKERPKDQYQAELSIQNDKEEPQLQLNINNTDFMFMAYKLSAGKYTLDFL